MKLGEKSYNRYHLLIAVGQAECQGVESFIKVNSVSCPQAYSLLHISQKPGNSQALQVNPVLQDARQDKAKCQKREQQVFYYGEPLHQDLFQMYRCRHLSVMQHIKALHKGARRTQRDGEVG